MASNMSLNAICDMPEAAGDLYSQPHQQSHLSPHLTPQSPDQPKRARASSNAGGILNRKCAYCDRRFSKAEHLKRHQRSHTGEKPFRCNVCFKSYARSDVLIRHTRNHHSDPAGNEAAGPSGASQHPDAKSPGSSTSDSAEDDSVGTHSTNAQTVMLGVQTHSTPLTPLPPLQNKPSEAPSSILGGVGALGRLTPLSHQTPPIQRMSSQHDGSCLLEAAIQAAGPSHSSSYHSVDRTNAHMIGHQAHVPQSKSHVSLEINDQQFYPFQPQPFNDLSHWLETCDSDLQPSLPYGLDLWGDSAMMDFMNIPEPFPAVPTPRVSRPPRPSFSKDCVPDERFQRVERLWPLRRSNTQARLGQTLWEQIVAHNQDGLFSEPGSNAVYPYPLQSRRSDSRWGLGEDCRARLIRDCSQGRFNDVRYSPEFADSNTSKRSDTASDDSLGTKFPPAEVLEMSLDLYFRRHHARMPFIHLATFEAKSTPSSLLMPMCLIGLEILDSNGSNRFSRAYLPDAIDRLRNELTARALPSCQPAQLFTTLASAVLLLRIAATNPVTGLEEQVQCLYTEAISLAQRRGLFTAWSGQQISIDLLRQGRDDDTSWKAWSRVECAKRLIVCLIMTDSFYSNILDITPTTAIDTLGFCIPCSTDLFEAANARKWAQAANTGNNIVTPTTSLMLSPSTLPALDTDIGIQGLLAGVWLRLSEVRHRLLNSSHTYYSSMSTRRNLHPLSIYSLDPSGSSIAPVLTAIPIMYTPLLRQCNPSTHAFWHSMCLGLCADLSYFELAAGREGPERAKGALDDIAAWSHTPPARRACLHAAQTFFLMSNRKISDGTTFHSEIALFNSALILGLYLFTVHDESPEANENAMMRDEPLEIFELLEPLDWGIIGSEGMTADATSSTISAPPGLMPDSAAKRFIAKGGPVSFNGAVHKGGYDSSRRILLEYANLMKSVAKWNVKQYQRILRIMSDTLIEVDDQSSSD